MAWTYQEAIDYLYSFINYEVKRQVRYAPSVISLDRPLALLEGLGSPHRAAPVIHVTGTKGKGSVGASCQAVLQAAGLRAGLYSSPHLQNFEERFRINDDMIGRDTLTRLLAEIKPVADGIPGLTWFELTTALAFLFFARQQVDIVVSEVGLGGRLDATNLVDPLVSVITSISYDHTHLLGNTLAEIAVEKAGIIKPGIPVVSAPQPDEAAAVLAEVSQERAAPLTVVGRDWLYEFGETTRRGQAFRAGRNAGPLRDFWTPLLGRHQVVNATVALAALDQVRQAGIPLTDKAVTNGLAQVNWPGRFEIVAEQPWLILDAAHNRASARCLQETLAATFTDVSNRIMIFGASADKDVKGMFAELLPAIDHLILAQAVHPRALAPDVLVAQAVESGFGGTVEAVPVVADALQRARELSGEYGLVVVTGSLFIVGEARDVCGLQSGLAAYQDRLMVRYL